MSEILDQLGQASYFTTLDLAEGYHQISMNPKDKEKTAFSTTYGHYHFLRMPFGLKGAPNTFQRLMNHILSGLNGIKCFVYLDDVVIYGVNLEDHNNRLKNVLTCFRTFNMKLQPRKCNFLRTEVKYLGHIITRYGTKPDPTLVDAILKFPIPNNIKEISSFLSLSGYYRQFIHDYAKIAEPHLCVKKEKCQTRMECIYR